MKARWRRLDYGCCHPVIHNLRVGANAGGAVYEQNGRVWWLASLDGTFATAEAGIARTVRAAKHAVRRFLRAHPEAKDGGADA